MTESLIQRNAPPNSEEELLSRARTLAGMSLGELANHFYLPIPQEQTHAKGWIGCLLEDYLGASAGSLPEPDFQRIGVELKTLPVVEQAKPKETTYVCTAPLLQLAEQTWHSSTVYKKLARVLWVPIEADKAIPLPQRRIGYALLWSPSAAQEAMLRDDWQMLCDMICMGRLAYIKGHHGQCLQLRPKAANAKSLCWGIAEDGQRTRTLPRGFYLRTSFTAAILQAHYKINV